MTVIATSSSLGLAARVASILSRDLIVAEEKAFPDGEKYVRIPRRVSGDAIIIHSLHPPQDERFVQLLLSIDAVRGAGASRVIVAIPYLAYARQDKRFLEGEPVSVRVILRSVEAANADVLITVDLHKPSSLDEWLKIPHANLLPVQHLASYFLGKLRDPVVLAPDKGALARAQLAAETLGASFDYLEKTRDKVTGEVSILPKQVEVCGRDVVFIDDIISTGGTLVAAARSVTSAGARSLYAACTHALLTSGALDKLYAAGLKEVVATDTVPSPVSKVSIAKPLAEAIVEFLVS